MQRLDYSTRERISTQSGAMALDVGRLELGAAVKLFFYSLGAWFLCCLGVLLISAAWGGSPYEHRAWTAIRWFIGTFGAGMSALASSTAATAVYLLVDGWFDYRARLQAWHRAELRAYRAAGGQQVDRQLTVKALTIQEPAHVILVALALAAKIRNGQVTEPSTAALQGDIWLGLVKVGELSKPQSEEFLRALHQVGLIKGRTKGKAGNLVTVEPAEILDLVTTRAGRIRQLPEPAEPAEPKGGD